MIQTLLVQFWWLMMQQDKTSSGLLSLTCHTCQICQTYYFHILPSIPKVPNLFHKVHINTFLMLPTGGYCYIVDAQDALTAWPEWRALTVETGKFIFENILCRWGMIEEIVTDNGPALVATVEHLVSKYGIHHIWISPYNSCANSLIEKQHFLVHKAIMKTCDGDKRKWQELIHTVFWAEHVWLYRD
jgi:hypothetical protein